MNIEEFAKSAVSYAWLKKTISSGEKALSKPISQEKARQLVRLSGAMSKRVAKRVKDAMSSAPQYLVDRIK